MTDAPSFLKAALWYATYGWRVFPCKPRGKEPLTAHGLKDATSNKATIRAWWRQWPCANIGIATGASGLVVVDVDNKGQAPGLDNWLDLKVELNISDETLISETPTGGLHIYYAAGDYDVRNSASRLAPGIDIRAQGGYVIAPPSIHPMGEPYVWAMGHHPAKCALLPLPEALAERAGALRGGRAPEPPRGGAQQIRDSRDIDIRDIRDITRQNQDITRQNRDIARDSRDIGGVIANGARNDTLASLAGAMRRRGMGQAAIEAALQVENAARCQPPLDAEEVRKIAASVSRYDPEQPQQYLTDLGNCRRLVAQHGENLRYVPAWGWLIWDGRRWARDEDGAIYRCAKETALSIYAEAEYADDLDERKRVSAWAKQSQSHARLRAMVELASTEIEVVARVEMFDADPMALNVLNGTLDLHTGELRPHRREDLHSKLAPVVYGPEARHPLWDKYLATVTQGNAELAAYLQRACGYCLTGSTSEEVVFLLLGAAQTGKTTLVEALRATLGDYAAKLAFSTFLERPRSTVGQPRDDVAGLTGVRLAVAAEASPEHRLDEVLLKELTGGDTITARFLYHSSFSFRPLAKLILAANKAPRMSDDDDAVWRRLRRLPFEYVIPPEERDEQVKIILRDPAQGGPAILAWAVQGCLAWQRQGLGYPDLIRSKTEDLRISFDPLADFFRENCVFGPNYEVEAGALREAYEQWSKENGNRYLLGNRQWSERLKARGCTREARRRGGKYIRLWFGIGLTIDLTGGETEETKKGGVSHTPYITSSLKGLSKLGGDSVSSVSPPEDAPENLDDLGNEELF